MNRNIGIYEKYVKRIFDVLLSVVVFVFLFWLFIIIAIMVRFKLGSPILFKQLRPGLIDRETGEEKIFKMYKFRTMTDERDEEGNLLPDEVRLTPFGVWLRKTSLDELPEIFNILRGDMSIIGPRPQLIRDMVFMTAEQRLRHTARPGLSGLAQVNGRNAISWEKKIAYDLMYIENVTWCKDVGIIFDTFKKAIIKKEGITEENMATAEDFGDYLLRTGMVMDEEYKNRQQVAREIERRYLEKEMVKNGR